MHIFYHSRFLSNLRLRWKTDLTWKFSLFWNIFYCSGILSNLLLPWKQNLPWTFSPASYAHGPVVERMKTLYFIMHGKSQFQNGMN